MGQTIEQLLHFEAIGLINTLFEAADGDFTCRRAHQYLNKVDTYNFHPSLDYFGGCEYLSTAADLATFYYQLFTQKVFEYHTTLDSMLQPFTGRTADALDYRCGIRKTKFGGSEAYTQKGF